MWFFCRCRYFALCFIIFISFVFGVTALIQFKLLHIPFACQINTPKNEINASTNEINTLTNEINVLRSRNNDVSTQIQFPTESGPGAYLLVNHLPSLRVLVPSFSKKILFNW